MCLPRGASTSNPFMLLKWNLHPTKHYHALKHNAIFCRKEATCSVMKFRNASWCTSWHCKKLPLPPQFVDKSVESIYNISTKTFHQLKKKSQDCSDNIPCKSEVQLGNVQQQSHKWKAQASLQPARSPPTAWSRHRQGQIAQQKGNGGVRAV